MSASFWAGVRDAQGQLIAQLASTLEEWRTTGEEPEIVGDFSSGERAAIFLAYGEENRLDSTHLSGRSSFLRTHSRSGFSRSGE